MAKFLYFLRFAMLPSEQMNGDKFWLAKSNNYVRMHKLPLLSFLLRYELLLIEEDTSFHEWKKNPSYGTTSSTRNKKTKVGS